MGVCSSGEEGGGSTFYFSLPALAAPPAPSQAKAYPVWLLTRDAQEESLLRDHLACQGLEVAIFPRLAGAKRTRGVGDHPAGAHRPCTPGLDDARVGWVRGTGGNAPGGDEL